MRRIGLLLLGTLTIAVLFSGGAQSSSARAEPSVRTENLRVVETVSPPPDGDSLAPPLDDTTPATVDPTADTAATPVPMTPGGPASAGAYATTLVGNDALGTDYGLWAVASTAPGTFAFTGVVVDDESGSPVSGATVTLESGAMNITTTTDERGACGFLNAPAGDGWTFIVSATGFGAYRWVNHSFPAGEYIETIFLRDEDQVFDDAPARQRMPARVRLS